MAKKTIGVFFGSRSPEHDVSIITGQLIISELKKLGYNVVPVYLDKKGRWFADKTLGTLKFFTGSDKEKKLRKMTRWNLDLLNSQGKIVLRKGKWLPKKIVIDIAFPAFHGLNGEDGTIQGLFEIFNITYVGCEVASSAVAMDKSLTKLFYKSLGIPTTDFIYFNNKDWEEDKQAILKKIKGELNFPIFIKPARLGSSIGMAKVKKYEELKNACEVALHYDNKIIVEVSVENLVDITCAVLGNDRPKASLIQESIFTRDHFSYEDKYLNDGGAQLGRAKDKLQIPARLPEETTKEVRAMAIEIFKKLGCSGTARVDFLYDKKGKKIYANEINTMPGTLYYHLWEKSGVKIDKLIESLIKLAQRRHEAKNKITSSFESNILSQANSIKMQMGNHE